MSADLFGVPIVEPEPMPMSTGKCGGKPRRKTRVSGYAGTPGNGPVGETCKTCAHYVRKEMSKTYLKCALMRHKWTGGPGTDIKASSPACELWTTRPAMEAR